MAKNLTKTQVEHVLSKMRNEYYRRSDLKQEQSAEKLRAFRKKWLGTANIKAEFLKLPAAEKTPAKLIAGLKVYGGNKTGFRTQIQGDGTIDCVFVTPKTVEYKEMEQKISKSRSNCSIAFQDLLSKMETQMIMQGTDFDWEAAIGGIADIFKTDWV